MSRLAAACREMKTESLVVAVISNDDPLAHEYEDSSYYKIYVDNETGGCVKSIVEGVKEFLKDYMHGYFDYFIFTGDDNLPRTEFWDRLLIKPLIGKTGISYGNDLYQQENLAGNPCISRDIAEILNRYGWPPINHLYIDNFFTILGKEINSLHYVPDSIIEHMHPFAGKGEMDEQYARVNRQELYLQDHNALESYLRSETFANIVNELRS